MDCPLAEAEGFFRDYQVSIKLQPVAKPLATRACTVGTVEGEESGRRFFKARTALPAGVALAVKGVLPFTSRQYGVGSRQLFTAYCIALTAYCLFLRDYHYPLSHLQAGLDGVIEPAPVGCGPDVLFHHEPIHHYLYVMGLVTAEFYGLGNIHQEAVHPGPDEALLPHGLKDLLVFPLLSLYYRGQEHQPGTGGYLHHPFHYLVRTLSGNFLTALRAVGCTQFGEEQPQVVVYLRDCGHGGAGAGSSGALFNGYGWGDAFNVVYVGFLHLLQELAGIGGQTFYVTPLPLGKDGVKGQGGLP